LQDRIEELDARATKKVGKEYFRAFEELKAGLNEGSIRAAEPDAASPTGWKVNAWVKKGILLGFRIGKVREMPLASRRKAAELKNNSALPIGFQFRDKETFPLKRIPPAQNVRVVPGGSSIRDGSYIGRNVVCMPPMYVDVGASVYDVSLIA